MAFAHTDGLLLTAAAHASGTADIARSEAADPNQHSPGGSQKGFCRATSYTAHLHLAAGITPSGSEQY